MKKLLIMFSAVALLISIGITKTAYAFPSYYEADFSEGIPDDWTIENEGSVSSDGTRTTIYTNTSGDAFDLYSDIELPQGFYEIKLNGWFGSNSYGSDNSLRYSIQYDDFTEIDSAELLYTHDSFTFLIGQYTDSNMERIELSFNGGYNTSIGEGDYMNIQSVEINRVLNVQSYNYLSDFEGGVDTSIKTIDSPSLMTEEKLSGATIYGVNDPQRGDVKLVERGEAVEGETYNTDDSSYKASWNDEGGHIFLFYDTYYDTDQGDVVVNNMDNYPYDVVVILHDESLEEEDEFAYSLEDYYLFEYDINNDNIFNEETILPHLGNTENMTMNRLSYANILLNNTEIVKHGVVTENEVLSHTFDEYGQSTYELVISEDQADAASMTLVGKEHFELLDKGELRVFNLDYPGAGDVHTLQVYLPKDVRDVEPPTYDEPSNEPNPNAPGGFQDLLTYYGLWNTAGILFLFAVVIIFANIGLSILGLNGIAIFVADVVILSLFLYMGLLPIWVAAVLIPILIAIFILTIKGGGIIE